MPPAYSAPAVTPLPAVPAPQPPPVERAPTAAIIAIEPPAADSPNLLWWLLIPAATAVAYCIDLQFGTYHPVAIPFLAAALVLAVLAIAVARLDLGATARRWSSPIALGLLGLSLAIGFCLSLRSIPYPNLTIKGLPELQQFLSGIGLAAVFAAAVISPRPFLGKATFPALIIMFVALGVWTVQNTKPNIDVFVFQQDSSAALLKGQNPYALTFADPYHGQSPWYGEGLSVNERLQFGYPYMPLSLLMSLPGYGFAGDCRYANLFALVLAAVLIGYSRATSISFGAAALLLFTSRTMLVIEESWTEPFAIFWLAAIIFCAARLPKLVPYALGVFFATKQYLPLSAPLLLLLCPWPLRWRDVWNMLWKSLLVAAILSLPMILWNFGAFWHSAVRVQLMAPFRPDALSFLAAWYGKNGVAPGSRFTPPGVAPSALPAFIAMLLAMALSIWRAPRSAAGFSGAVALSYLAFFSLNKQAFANYYFFVIGAMCCAIAAAAAPNRPVGDQIAPSLPGA